MRCQAIVVHLSRRSQLLRLNAPLDWYLLLAMPHPSGSVRGALLVKQRKADEEYEWNKRHAHRANQCGIEKSMVHLQNA